MIITFPGNSAAKIEVMKTFQVVREQDVGKFSIHSCLNTNTEFFGAIILGQIALHGPFFCNNLISQKSRTGYILLILPPLHTTCDHMGDSCEICRRQEDVTVGVLKGEALLRSGREFLM